MKKVTFFLIILYSLNLFSQTFKIEYYIFTKNTIDTTGIRSYLLFNNNKSLFVWKSIIAEVKNTKEITKDGEADIKFKSVYNDTLGTRVLNIFEKDKIILREPLLNDNFIVIDNKPKLNWEIKNEYKDFLTYKCQKATANFRGRNYIAWFTSSIPVPTGPWKLNGLPGLILEAYDENKEVNFLFKKITACEDCKEKIEIIQNKETISIEEFVKIKDDLHKKLITEALSKLPRGVTLKSTHTSQRKGIEKTYEWEED